MGQAGKVLLFTGTTRWPQSYSLNLFTSPLLNLTLCFSVKSGKLLICVVLLWAVGGRNGCRWDGSDTDVEMVLSMVCQVAQLLIGTNPVVDSNIVYYVYIFTFLG